MRSRANSILAGPTGAAVRGVRAATYASYLARCAAEALSVGITTSPCDTRAAAPAGCAFRNARIWDCWIDAKSSTSSARTTDEVRKLTPFSPAQRADASDAPPYHIRDRSPGECGCTRDGELLEAVGPGERRRGRPGDEPQQPRDPLVAEVLEVGRVGIQRLPHVVPVHRLPDAEPRVEPAAGEHIDGRQVLGQPERVLPAERDHRRAELDSARCAGLRPRASRSGRRRRTADAGSAATPSRSRAARRARSPRACPDAPARGPGRRIARW